MSFMTRLAATIVDLIVDQTVSSSALLAVVLNI